MLQNPKCVRIGPEVVPWGDFSRFRWGAGLPAGQASAPIRLQAGQTSVHTRQSISDVRGGEPAGCGMQRRLDAGSTDKLCSGFPKKNKYCASFPRARIPASDTRG